MDVQLKKGLLDTCVLSCLRAGESYGYKLITEVNGIIEVSESTLYPILRRLENGGYLETQSHTHGGRLRKYYYITATGREKLKAAKQDFIEMRHIFEEIFWKED
ncbi:MAG: PadR family transcriptional regulator [Firmicutes bacterium]|nr:PadR family transcriptional regulator [Bacillota bacterium]